MFQVCPSKEYQRKLHPDDLPLRTQAQWSRKPEEERYFLVSRNPEIIRSRSLDHDDLESAQKPEINRSNSVASHQTFKSIEDEADDTRSVTNLVTKNDPVTRSEACLTRRKIYGKFKQNSLDNNNDAETRNNNLANPGQRLRKCDSCNDKDDAFAICEHKRYEPVYRLRTISNHEDLFDRLRAIKLSNERKIMLDVPSGPQSLTKGNSESCFYV